ncbi:MAG: hypothetical protein QOH12_3549, partial [Solirubrobacteraceae bacterium]|nr:hypothetical protein [Solirubrobacteraceae bacterium]
PWNRDFCEEEGLICAPDWAALAARLRPLLESQRSRSGVFRTESRP